MDSSKKRDAIAAPEDSKDLGLLEEMMNSQFPVEEWTVNEAEEDSDDVSVWDDDTIEDDFFPNSFAVSWIFAIRHRHTGLGRGDWKNLSAVDVTVSTSNKCLESGRYVLRVTYFSRPPLYLSEVCSQPDVLGANEASYLLSTVILHYLDFSRFALPSPVFINIVREPLDRLVSYYYFLRYGDDFRPKLVRRKGNTETFDECVERGEKDCDPKNLLLQLPFSCGHSAECRKLGQSQGTGASNAQSRRSLLGYPVGITEQLADFVKVLELTLLSRSSWRGIEFDGSKLRRRLQSVAL